MYHVSCIIAYDRALHEKAPDEEPMFKGTNYVCVL